MSDYDQPRGVEPRRPIRRAARTTTAAPTPPIPARPPSRAAGVGSQTARCYCPCGGKLRHGKCVRGCS